MVSPASPRSLDESYTWLHFAARSGEPGRSWCDVYRSCAPLAELADQALTSLRRRCYTRGEELLRELEAGMEALDDGIPTSVRHVLGRFYHGVDGYYFYCLEDYDQAARAMQRAHESVVAAISRRRFLLPLANHCHEFCLHRARIARNQRHWAQMDELVAETRAMMEDRRPLCELADATRVTYSTLHRHYLSLSLRDPEWQEVRALMEQDSRLRLFDRFVRRLYVVPGFVIPYP